MTIKSQTSLAKKLTISTIALLGSSVVLITLIIYMTVVHFGNDFLISELNHKSRFIKKAFTEPIWTYDQNQIVEIGNSLLTDSKYTYISAIRIETTNNETLFEKGQDGTKTFNEAAGMPYTQTKVIEVFKDEAHIGTVSLAMTNYGYIKAFRNQFIFLILASLVILFILSQLVRYYFNRTLTRPMNKILKHVREIEDEQYLQHDVENLPQELESISKALNQVALVIEKRNNDIMFYTQDLEKLVQARTSELEEQMSKNLNTARLAAIGELAADVAHEVNNPLTIIDLYASKLKKYESENNQNPEIGKSIDKIQMMIKRIGKIIKGLKTMSRDGNADPMMAFSVTNVMEDVKMFVEMKLKVNNIEFDFTVDPADLMVYGREVQISQVLVNLIGNAADAIIDFKEKWIQIEIKEMGDSVCFYITDCGNGIDENILDKIMHPFFTTKEVNKGTGLGLSISKSIIEEHGGELAYNCKHAHTQFIFSLKKAKLAKQSA
jgi:two-component system NtrC family sensor kinase